MGNDIILPECAVRFDAIHDDVKEIKTAVIAINKTLHNGMSENIARQGTVLRMHEKFIGGVVLAPDRRGD